MSLLRDLVIGPRDRANYSLHYLQKYPMYIWCLESFITVL